MPDNWSFVLAAYGLTAVALGLYWRHLVRKEKELQRLTTAASKTGGGSPRADSTRDMAGTTRAHMERAQEASASDRGIAERSREPSRPGHPRPDPTSRHPQ